MKVLGLVKKIDIFGRSVELRLDKSKKHKTYCGALITMVIFLITVFVAYILINQYFQYGNPFLRIYKLKQDSSTGVAISLDALTGSNLKLGVIDSISSEAIDSSLLVILAYISTQSPNQQQSVDNAIQLTKCLPNTNMYCLEMSTISLLPFQTNDFLPNSNNKFLKFEIMECITYKALIGSTSMSCGSTTEIADALTRAVIWLSFDEYEVDPIEYDFPIRTISRDFHKGIIQESFNTIDITSFKEISAITATTQTALVTVNVVLDEEKYYYERTYSKVQVYLAYVGGIIKMLTMLGEFVTRPFARLSLNTKIVNEVFDFEGGDANDGSNDLISMEELQQEFHLYEENMDNLSEKSPDKLLSKSTLPIKNPSSPVQIELADQQINDRSMNYTRMSGKNYESLNNNQLFVPANEQQKYQQQQSPLIKIHKTTETTSQGTNDRYKQRPRAVSTIQDYLKEGRKRSTLKNTLLPYQLPQCGRIMDLSKINEAAQEIELRSQIDYSKGSNSTKHNQLLPPKVIIKQSFEKNELMVSSALFNQKMNSFDQLKKTHSASPTAYKDRGRELSQIQESRQNRPKLLRSSSIPLVDTVPADGKYVRKQQNMQLSVIEDRESRVSNKGKSNNNNNNTVQEKESESKSSKKYESQGSSDSDSDDSSSSDSSSSSSPSSQSFPSQSSQSQSQIQALSSDKPKDESGPMSTAHCEAMQRAFCINTMSSSKTENKPDQLSKNKHSQQTTLNNNNQQSIASKDRRKSKKNVQKKHQHGSQKSDSLNIPQDEENTNIIPVSLYYNPQNSSPEKQSHNALFHKKSIKNQEENNEQNCSTQNPANAEPPQATTPKRFISNFSSSQRNNSNSNYENQRNSEGINMMLIPMKSEGGSSSQSPGLSRLQNRESLASDSSSPGKSGTFKFFAGDNSQNEKSAEKKPQSMYALHHPRNSIMFPMNQPNNRISAEYNNNNNEGNFQMRTSASPGMRRSTSKRYSVLEKQKIFALTKLMDNYQNHQETKVDELKNFEKLVHSPKKKSNNPDSIFKRLFRESKVLKLKFYDYCLYYLQFFSKIYSEKKKQIKFSKQKVKERLDVVYIIQKLVEIDKLKMLLLNEDQLKLFEYLPKPIVHMDPQEPPRSPSLKGKEIHEEQTHPSTMLQAWSMLHQQKKPIQKAIEASRVYKQMMDCDPDMLSETDKKLIDMLDLRIKEIFDVNNEIQRQKTMHTILTPGKPNIGPERIDPNTVDQIILGASDNTINKRFMSAQMPLKVNLQKMSSLEKYSYPQSSQFMAGCGDAQNSLPPPPQLINCKVSAFEGLPLCDETQAAFLDQDPSVTINNNNMSSNLKGNASFLFDRDIAPLIEDNAKQGLMVGSTKGEVLKRNQSTNVGTSSGSMQIDTKRNEGGSKTPKPPPPAESLAL